MDRDQRKEARKVTGIPERISAELEKYVKGGEQMNVGNAPGP